MSRRWAFLLAPLVLPWAVVTWEGGAYTVFALGWIDVGFRVGTVLTYLAQGSFELRTFTVAYPLALALYLAALVAARWDPLEEATSALVSGLLVLSGLNVGFYALGIAGQAGLAAYPLGLLWLWAAGALEYRRFYAA